MNKAQMFVYTTLPAEIYQVLWAVARSHLQVGLASPAGTGICPWDLREPRIYQAVCWLFGKPIAAAVGQWRLDKGRDLVGFPKVFLFALGAFLL